MTAGARAAGQWRRGGRQEAQAEAAMEGAAARGVGPLRGADGKGRVALDPGDRDGASGSRAQSTTVI